MNMGTKLTWVYISKEMKAICTAHLKSKYFWSWFENMFADMLIHLLCSKFLCYTQGTIHKFCFLKQGDRCQWKTNKEAKANNKQSIWGGKIVIWQKLWKILEIKSFSGKQTPKKMINSGKNAYYKILRCDFFL